MHLAGFAGSSYFFSLAFGGVWPKFWKLPSLIRFLKNLDRVISSAGVREHSEYLLKVLQEWIRSESSVTKQRVQKSDQYFEALFANKLCSYSSQVLRSATKDKSLLSRKHLTSTPMEAAYCKHPLWRGFGILSVKWLNYEPDYRGVVVRFPAEEEIFLASKPYRLAL